MRFVIASRDRSSSSSSSADCAFNLHRQLPAGRVTLVSAWIPNTQLPVSSRNNTLAVSIAGAAADLVEIAVGSYTPTTLAAALKTALDAATEGVFTVTVSGATNRLTFGCATAFAFLGDQTGNRVVGLDPYGDSASVTAYEAPFAPQLAGQSRYSVEIEGAEDGGPTSLVGNHEGSFTVPATTGYGNVIFHTDDGRICQTVRLQQSIRQLRVRILDEAGRTALLEGADWSIVVDSSQ